MAENVVRKDVIEIGFKTDMGSLNKLTSGMDKLKASVNSLGGDSGLKKTQKDVDNLKKSVDSLGSSSGISRFTQKFQSVNRSIQDGEAAMAKLKNSIKSIPHNVVSKISNGFTDLKTKVVVTTSSVKALAKTKLSNLKSDISATKAALTGGQSGAKGFKNVLSNIGKIGFGKVANGIQSIAGKLTQGVSKGGSFRDKLKDVGKTSFSKIASGLSTVGKKLAEIASKAGKAAYNALKKVAGVSFKALAAGIGGASVAVGAVVKSAVSAYGENQQQVGGIETLFGAGGAQSVEEYAQSVGKSVAQVQDKYNALKASESKALEYASQAYKTAGLSANEYMETSTSFAASLLQSVGGDTMQAAEKANTAIIDMSDNANKMGTSMESIQNAYQGFAKQNWTMLDNLKLGYGGTKEEMERLLADAGKIAGKSFSKENLSDVFEAIHIIQNNLGITGTTAKEAEGTITGSLSMVKASWNNMLVALVKGDGDFETSLTNLIDSAMTFGKNIIPAIQSALSGVGRLINELAPVISEEIPALMESVVPNLLGAATEIVNGLMGALPTILSSAMGAFPSLANTLLNAFVSLISGLLGVLQNSGPQIILTLIESLNTAIISLLGLLPQLTTVGVQLINSLLQGLAQAAPTLIPAICESALGIVNSLLQQLPAFIDAGIQIIQGLVQGIVASIPAILKQAPTLIQSFTTALIEGIPALVNGAIAIINALGQGLIDNLPTIILAAKALITELCGGLIANLPQIIRSAISLIYSLCNAFQSNGALLLDAAIQIIIGLVQGFYQNMPTIILAAYKILFALADGLIQAIPTILNAIPTVFGALWDAIKSIDWITLGKDIIEAIWEGIKTAGKSLWSGIKGLFGGDEKSTEAKTAGDGVGNSFSSGIASGIDTNGLNAVGSTATSSLATGMTSNVGAITTASQDMSTAITSNVNTDLTSAGATSATNFASGLTGGTGEVATAAQGLSSEVQKTTDGLVDDTTKKVSELPAQMAESIKNSGTVLSDAFVSIWEDAVKACVTPVNKLIDGANWVLKEFGSEKVVASWQPYAKGTNGHKGGNALVNDGRGAELVQMPNGNAFIPKGRNVFIPNAPKGMKVLSAENTAQLMGKKSATFRYADGTGDIDIWDYADNASGLISKVADKFVSYGNAKGLGFSAGKGMVSTIQGEMSPWAEKLYDEYGALSLANYIASKGVEQWRSTVIRALRMENQYSEANVTRTLHQMQTESGGNPRAINLWDSNAKKGIPSKGLMQVIDPTFNAYARAGFNKNIYDPLSNILASIRYAVSRYGSLAKAYRGVGYANGGIATKPSVFGEDGAEMAIPLSSDKRKRALSLWNQTGSMLGVTLASYSPEKDSESYQGSTTVENNTYAPEFNLTISGTSDDRAMARKVKQWVSEALDETFDSFYRKNKRIQEI